MVMTPAGIAPRRCRPRPMKPIPVEGANEREFAEDPVSLRAFSDSASAAVAGESVAAFPGALGLVHGAIGLYQQFVGDSFPKRRRAAAGDADARADAQPLLGEHLYFADRRHHRFGDRNRVGPVMGYFHEDHELVAADPGERVSLANPAPDALGDLLKQAVPRLVPQ